MSVSEAAARRLSAAYTASSIRSLDRRSWGIDLLALGIEQYGIFEGGGKHPPFFEADYEERPSVGERRLRKHRHMEMPGTRTMGTHPKPADPLAKLPQSHFLALWWLPRTY